MHSQPGAKPQDRKHHITYFFLRPADGFFLSDACVNADAATDFTVFGVFLSARSLDAFDATFGEVFSFFAISTLNCVS